MYLFFEKFSNPNIQNHVLNETVYNSRKQSKSEKLLKPLVRNENSTQSQNARRRLSGFGPNDKVFFRICNFRTFCFLFFIFQEIN